MLAKGLSLVFSWQAGKRYMSFVWSSLDDSSDQKGKDIFVVAGFMATQDEWTEIERRWMLRLEKENSPLTYFRATDCKSRSEGYRRFRDLEKYTREEGIAAATKIRNDLKDILMQSPCIPIAHGILLPDYRRVRKSSNARRMFPSNPYLAGYQQIIIKNAQLGDECDPPEMIAVLCDSHNLASRLHDVFGELKKKIPVCGRCLGSLTTHMNDEQSPAIQCADLLASICKDAFLEKGFTEHKDHPSRIRMREEWKNLYLSFWNAGTMRNIVAAHFTKKGKPSIHNTNQFAFFDMQDSFLIGSKEE